jgi:hypothetical protein
MHRESESRNKTVNDLRRMAERRSRNREVTKKETGSR